jgi:hypothetical protein
MPLATPQAGRYNVLQRDGPPIEYASLEANVFSTAAPVQPAGPPPTSPHRPTIVYARNPVVTGGPVYEEPDAVTKCGVLQSGVWFALTAIFARQK